MTNVGARYLPFLPLVAAVVLALTALAPGTASGDTELIAAGPQPDLLLISTGDVIGYLEPCG